MSSILELSGKHPLLIIKTKQLHRKVYNDCLAKSGLVDPKQVELYFLPKAFLLLQTTNKTSTTNDKPAVFSTKSEL